jgi:hypothetical protein
MKRNPTSKVLRAFLRSVGLGLSLLCCALCLVPTVESAHAGSAVARRVLPAPLINPHSTEICMNSRISYHGGWSSGTTEQMLANVLCATARAPLTGAPLVIYAATAQDVSVYDAASHSLVLHKAGDWRSDTSAGFEVGVAATNMVDAGAAMHLAQLESVALWTGTANQLATCPRASATTYANSHWDPADPIDIVISFGMRSVPGFTSDLVAVSSDGTLPNPATDGPVFLDSALDGLAYDSTFAAADLAPEEISQVLWASYGCSDHSASGKAGLVCASAVANYYLTRRIYAVDAGGVHRFHNRRPPGTDATTRDHRLELIGAADVRAALRQNVSRLPDAPDYFVICVGATGAWPELEVGFAAIGAVLEASTMGLRGNVTTDLSAAEQTGIRTATGIPAADIPIAVVSLGRSPDSADVPATRSVDAGLGLSIERAVTDGSGVPIHYTIPAETRVDLAVYDCAGRRVAMLFADVQSPGPHAAVWDCRSDGGRKVVPGVYFLHLRAAGQAKAVQVVVVR